MRDVEARLKISAIDRTGNVLSNVGNKLSAVNARAAAYNQTQTALYRTGSLLSSQMAMLARYVGPAALGYELVRGTRAAGNFEESLFNIQKKSGATREQMEKLGGEIRSLAKTDIPMSMDEIASAFERGAAAGIPLDELKGFAKLATQVADAWDVSAEDAGNFFAGFNKGLNIPLNEMQSFASLINDLADSGISDEKDIADFVDRVGASLKNFGMTPNEIAAYGAAMLNLKMPSEVAARAMDTIAGKLLAPENLSKKARPALEEIVGDLGKFAKLTGNQKMVKFLESVEKLSNQRRASLLGALLGEGFDDEIMRLVSGSDELRRNLAMAEQHTKTPSDSIAGVSEKKLELFNSRVTILKNQLADIELSLGQRTLPAAEKVVGALSKALAAQDALNAGLKKTTGDDPAMAVDQRKEFKRRFEEAGLGDKTTNHHMEYWKALKAVGRGEYKDVWGYFDDLELRKDPMGKLKNLYSKGYVPGRGPENALGVEPSTGAVPVPAMRPSADEMTMYRLSKQYRQAENFGREYVAGAVSNSRMAPEAALNAFYGDSSSADAIRASIERKRALRAARGDVSAGDSSSPDMSELTRQFDEGGRSLAQGGEDGGKAFLQSVTQAAELLTSAAAQAAAALSNIKINTSGLAPKPSGDTGKTNGFVQPGGSGW